MGRVATDIEGATYTLDQYQHQQQQPCVRQSQSYYSPSSDRSRAPAERLEVEAPQEFAPDSRPTRGMNDNRQRRPQQQGERTKEASKNLDETGLQDASKETEADTLPQNVNDQESGGGADCEGESEKKDGEGGLTAPRASEPEPEPEQPDSDGRPSYAEILKGAAVVQKEQDNNNCRESHMNLGGSYERIDPIPRTRGTSAPPPSREQQWKTPPGRAATSNGLAGTPEPSMEARELLPVSLAGGGFGSNIGDADQQTAHALPPLEIKEPQQTSTARTAGKPPRVLGLGFTASPTEFTSGSPLPPPTPPTSATPAKGGGVTAVSTAMATAAAAGPSKRPSTGLADGHKPKAARHDHEQDSAHAHHRHQHHYSSRSPPPQLLCDKLLELLRDRDSAIADLKHSLGELVVRIDRLEQQPCGAAVVQGRQDEPQGRKEVFATVRVAGGQRGGEDREGVGGGFGLWGWGWGEVGVLMLCAAVVGGWVGLQMERGDIGRSLAEWVWHQAGRAG